MTEQWYCFQKLLLTVMCRIEHYTLTSRSMANGSVWYNSDDPTFRLTGPGVNLMMDDIWNTSTLEQNSIRLDAVTSASFPTDRLQDIINCFRPVGEYSPVSRTPKERLLSLSQGWHCGIADAGVLNSVNPEMKEVRFSFGQPTLEDEADSLVAGPHPQTAAYYYSKQSSGRETMCKSSDDMAADVFWKCRSELEFIPAKIYHRLVYYSHYVTGYEDMWESSIYVCFADNGTAAERLYDIERRQTPRVLDFTNCDRKCLAYGLQWDRGYLGTISDIRSQPIPTNEPAAVNGINGLGLNTIEICRQLTEARTKSAIDAITTNNGTSNVRRDLVKQHEGDAMWKFCQPVGDEMCQ